MQYADASAAPGRRGRDVMRQELKANDALERATLVIARYVHRHPGGVSRPQAKDAAGRWKPLASSAITTAIERGYVRAVPIKYNGNEGHRYHPGAITP